VLGSLAILKTNSISKEIGVCGLAPEISNISVWGFLTSSKSLYLDDAKKEPIENAFHLT
jgi:hypothetical protein